VHACAHVTNTSMVKAYLRYEPASKFGVIASSANVVYSADGKFLYTSALEDVAVWNVKQGSLVRAGSLARLTVPAVLGPQQQARQRQQEVAAAAAAAAAWQSGTAAALAGGPPQRQQQHGQQQPVVAHTTFLHAVPMPQTHLMSRLLCAGGPVQPHSPQQQHQHSSRSRGDPAGAVTVRLPAGGWLCRRLCEWRLLWAMQWVGNSLLHRLRLLHLISRADGSSVSATTTRQPWLHTAWTASA
jgi:hypothetical protein